MPTVPLIKHDHSRCSECPIRHRAVCAYCEPEDLVELDEIKSYRRFQAGETIVWAGEKMTIVGTVVSGVATLSRTLSDGRRQMVGLLLPSDFIGRTGREIAPYDVVAAHEVMICQFHKPQFEKIVATTPALERRLLEMTLDELDAAREWMLLLGRKTAREKIASLLVIIGRRHAMITHQSVQDGLKFVLPITREAMADYLGLTIETVSRQISALKRDELIVLEDARHVRIPDFGALLDESGDDSDGGMIA